MNRPIVLILTIFNFYSMFAMNTYQEVQQNAAFFQQLVHHLHSPTYLEMLMRQHGISQEKIPKKMQRFYNALKPKKKIKKR